jgi:hypothetical protein
MRALLVALLLASTAAAECPVKAPTRNYAEMHCASTGRTSWIEMRYYYHALSDCTPITVAVITHERTCSGAEHWTCSGTACPW